jgi:uncharacterized protein (TIGR03067 family)
LVVGFVRKRKKGNNMKRIKDIVGFVFVVALLGVSGCSTLRKSDSASLQGAWQGKEIGGKTEGMCYIVVSGNNAEYRGADTNEWYKATFTLREDTSPRQIVCLTTGSSYPPMIGTTRYGIYRFEDGMVRLAINESDNPTVPPDFNAPGARHFKFRKQ